jgi:hypothetical protein
MTAAVAPEAFLVADGARIGFIVKEVGDCDERDLSDLTGIFSILSTKC